MNRTSATIRKTKGLLAGRFDGLTPSRLDRRGFLRRIGAGALGNSIFPLVAPALAQDSPKRLLAMLGKDPRLIVHNTRPGVVETPVELLREHSITPKELLFVRSNQVPPGALTLDPLPAQDWELEMSGLLTPARTLRQSDLAECEQTEIEAVLQCSGNGRSFYATAAKARGTQWQRGGMGNLRWKGVRLKQLLDSLGMVIDPRARFLTAEGRDSPTSPAASDFEQCVPLDDVLEAALLATQMNGESIPAIHGGPVRLILPGYYGSMNVKWLSRLRFEARASQNRHHVRRYRTFVERVEPGSAPAVTVEATVPTWRQKVKSVIWNPVEGAKLAAGPVEVSGVAWNDGRTEIVAVEVSGDGGETWRRADFEAPSSPYGWHPWKHTIELSSGVAEIRVRAADAVGRGQPLDGSVHWNPSGYEWYGADGIRVTVG